MKTARKPVTAGAGGAPEYQQQQQQVKAQLHQLLASYRRYGQMRRLRPLSLDGREYELRHWIDWLEREKRLRSLHLLAPDDIVAFLAQEQTRLMASTVVTMFNHLKAFCNWLVREGYIERSPMASMETPKAPRKVTPILSHDEVTSLLEACAGKRFNDRRDYALVLLLLDSGLRISEMLSIQAANVKLNHQVLLVVGKGGDERLVPYGDKAAVALDRYLNLRAMSRHAHLGALWLSQQGALTSSTVRWTLRRRGEAAGLAMWPHRLRHQFAHMTLSAGMQERDVMTIGGWTTPTMLHTIYGAAAATERAIEAHKKHSPGDKF